MRRTQRIDLLTTIRGSIASFIAIAMFVALGVGLFLGIHWVAGAAHAMATEQFGRGSMHDVEITFPYGLSVSDVEALQKLDSDDLEVEAGWLSFQEAKADGRNVVFRVGTVPQSIDTFVEVEGTLPVAANEIALSKTTAERFGYAVGDTIAFLPDGANGKGMRYLNNDTFTVTALVTSPAFLAANSASYGMSTVGSGSIDVLAWAAPDAFNRLSYLNSTPYVTIRSGRLSTLDPFGNEYREGVRELEAKVSAVGDRLAPRRVANLHTIAAFINDEIVSEIEDVAKEYVDIAQRRASEALDEQGYADELNALVAKVKDLLGQHDVDVSLMEDQDITELLTLFVDPAFEFVSNGTLDMARESLASIVDYSWIVLSRSYNGAVVLMEGYTGVTANLRWSMASLFLIVGILVCYSAVSRLVHEQATRIGTKKALGFRAKEVNSLFLSYAALSVVCGLVVGVAVVAILVQKILLGAMANRFVMPVDVYVNPTDIALIGALEFVLILGATWFAVSGVLRRQAVELLAGERPSTAKARFYERWGLWRRMGLLAQTTVNNCINDTRRVVGTLVGVAGCTALIACAVTLNDNVMRSFGRQYDAIMHYDAVSTVEPGSKAATEGAQNLEAQGMEAVAVFQRTFTLRQPDGSLSTATVTVPQDTDAFDGAMSLLPVGSRDAGEGGVWVSEAYHEHLKAQVGDVITLTDTTGTRCDLPIAGFFEWHLLSNQIIVPASVYEASFGVRPEANRLLVRTNDKEATDVVQVMRRLAGYVSTRDDYAANKRGFDEFSSVSRIVVVVYLALAAVMAACVLLNLDLMFVSEKKRELIVLMINGYSLRDAKGYIWHDSVVLTALGIVCGLILGGVVGSLTIRSVEQANTSFLHGVSWLAMGAAVLGTAVLAAAALLVALRRIKGFALTDISRF